MFLDISGEIKLYKNVYVFLNCQIPTDSPKNIVQAGHNIKDC